MLGDLYPYSTRKSGLAELTFLNEWQMSSIRKKNGVKVCKSRACSCKGDITKASGNNEHCDHVLWIEVIKKFIS
jgi:hypothetical protein